MSEQETQETPRIGSPTKRRRTSKIDTVLAEAKDTALTAILDITDPSSVGAIHHLRAEEDRLTTHLFECTLAGYRGWFWFATLARAPRSKKATVCEVGLLPGDDSLLAPAWVPWSERLKNISREDLEALEESREYTAELDELAELAAIVQAPEAPADTAGEAADGQNNGQTKNRDSRATVSRG